MGGHIFDEAPCLERLFGLKLAQTLKWNSYIGAAYYHGLSLQGSDREWSIALIYGQLSLSRPDRVQIYYAAI